YNRLRRRGVDLASFADPYLGAVQDYYASLERDLWVLDITSDLPVPAFACLSRRRRGPAEDILLGLGAHFDPRVALLRAVTEVNHSPPSATLPTPSAPPRSVSGDERARRWWTTATLDANPYLRPDPDLPPARREDFRDLSRDDLRDDVQTCAGLARDHGLE